MAEQNCNTNSIHECLDCRKYSSMHSEHYDRTRGEKVSNVNCGIGGYLYFDENGNLIPSK